MVFGFDKKSLRPTKVTLRIFLSLKIESMSADREVQELLREFEQRGLQNLKSTPPASAPHQETPPVPNQPMQTRSTKNKFKAEIRSQRNEERYKNTGILLRMKGWRIEQARAVVEVVEGMTMVTGI